MTDEQFYRLPQYAQEEIHGLRDRIDRLNTDLRRAREQAARVAGLEPTDVVMVDGMDEHPLPSGVEIRFRLPDRRWIEAKIRDGGVKIRASGVLVIRPGAANAATLDTER